MEKRKFYSFLLEKMEFLILNKIILVIFCQDIYKNEIHKALDNVLRFYPKIKRLCI